MAESQNSEDSEPLPSATEGSPIADETSSGARQKLRGIVNRFSGLKLNWNLKPNLPLSLKLSKTAERETRVPFHIINVGQGDTFLVEIQEEPGLLARVTGRQERQVGKRAIGVRKQNINH